MIMKNNDSCDKFLQLLSSYIDNEVNDSEKRCIEEHINACESCNAEYLMMKNLSSQVQALMNSEDIPIPDFSSSIMERLNTPQDKKCEEVAEELSAFFDGELDTVNYYSIEEHLESCETCKDKYQQLEYIRKLIKSSVESLDIDLWEKVYARLIQPDQLECGFVMNELSAYMDKELPGVLQRNISEHILSCKTCRKEFENIKTIQEKVKQILLWPAEDVNLWPAISYRLNREIRHRTFMWSSAASMLTICLVWLSLSNVLMPIENGTISIRPDVKDSTELSLSPMDPNIVAEHHTSSDDYLFSNALNPPPSGVVPIMYQEDSYDDLGF